MDGEIESISRGTVTSPGGFRAGATYAHLKKNTANAPDLGILFSEVPSTAAGLFTSNKIKAAPVILSQQRLLSGKASAIIVNSGCANASTGETGLSDAAEMANLAAEIVGVSADEVLVASTGVIGQRLPMHLIKDSISKIVLSADGGHDLAEAIMTTDTFPKETAVSARTGKDRSDFRA